MRIDSALGEVRIKELKELMAKDPKDPWPHFMLGEIYFNNEMYEKALEEYEIAIKLDPHVPDFYYKKALSLVKLRREEEAIKTLQKARIIDYQNAETYYFLEGNILEELGKYEEAIKVYNDALSKRFNEWIFEAKILDLLELGKYEEAIKEIDKILTIYQSSRLYILRKNIIKEIDKRKT
ncbi:hypothetical protein SJAV_25690 [Sulfurisphaera javensis]|uniref:Tetratricopeptide repeat protein n=1 Tax=Sulfurisphaera javensis TaxID=2049879 RepID=A0AAT9GUL6_9CREN